MYKTAAALKAFFSGFGLPAYEQGSVPDDVELPYITYSFSTPEWNQKASMFAQIWDRTKSNAGILRKADEIHAAIGIGRRIFYSGGYVDLWPETPFCQIMTDGDYRSAYINLSINSYYLPGE